MWTCVKLRDVHQKGLLSCWHTPGCWPWSVKPNVHQHERKMAQNSELNAVLNVTNVLRRPCSFLAANPSLCGCNSAVYTPPRLSFTQSNFNFPGKKRLLWGSLLWLDVLWVAVSVPVSPVATQLTGLFSLPKNQTPSQGAQGWGVGGSHLKLKNKNKKASHSAIAVKVKHVLI